MINFGLNRIGPDDMTPQQPTSKEASSEEQQLIHQQTLQQLLDDPNLQLNEQIQPLWSGYGQVVRVFSPKQTRHFVVKIIGTAQPISHPRGWNSSVGHQRKVRSYQVESEFYKQYAALTNEQCKVPKLVAQL